MLKEAIAEAKTIKETAIANAKAALEEAFTPQLTAMFAERLNEEEEEEEMKKENYSMEEEELEETFNLDEILAELSETEETDEAMKTDDTMEGIDEDLMLEEMSDEEIEELVMKVIDDMIETGKLMPGEGEEEDLEDVEDLDGEDVEDEIDEAQFGDEFGGKEVPKKFKDSDSTDWVEDKTSAKGKFSDKSSKAYYEDEDVSLDELLNELMGEEKEEVKETAINEYTSDYVSVEAALTAIAALASATGALAWYETNKQKIKSKLEANAKSKAATDTNEMEETISELRNELNEVNLLNAKLLYTNKIFKTKNLTESEKIKVLNTFDKAETVKEVKLVFETLTESFKPTVKKAPIKESLGSASRSTAPTQTKQPIIEVNDAFARMQRLAGLRK